MEWWAWITGWGRMAAIARGSRITQNDIPQGTVDVSSFQSITDWNLLRVTRRLYCHAICRDSYGMHRKSSTLRWGLIFGTWQYLVYHCIAQKTDWSISRESNRRSKGSIEEIDYRRRRRQNIETGPGLSPLLPSLPYPLFQYNATLLMNILVRSTLCSKQLAEKHRLNSEAFEWLLGEIETRFQQAIAQPGEMVSEEGWMEMGIRYVQLILLYIFCTCVMYILRNGGVGKTNRLIATVNEKSVSRWELWQLSLWESRPLRWHWTLSISQECPPRYGSCVDGTVTDLFHSERNSGSASSEGDYQCIQAAKDSLSHGVPAGSCCQVIYSPLFYYCFCYCYYFSLNLIILLTNNWCHIALVKCFVEEIETWICRDAEKAKDVLCKLEHTTLRKVTANTAIYYDPDPQQTCITEVRERDGEGILGRVVRVKQWCSMLHSWLKLIEKVVVSWLFFVSP